MPLLVGGVAGALLLLIVALGGGITGALSGSTGLAEGACAPTPTTNSGTIADIPSTYMTLYVRAAGQYGVPWSILAAVGSAESDHGRSTLPGIRSGENSAGAGGPMQFLSSTWQAFGVDGNQDRRKDRYDPADAIPAAARYLKHNGAPQRIRNALFQYNHSQQYVTRVLKRAQIYAEAGTGSASSTESMNCAGAPMALPPNAVAAKVVAYARTQLGKPYVWGAEGPNAFDCSGLTFAAYQSAGVSIPRISGDQWKQAPRVPRGREQPGDLVFFNSGPGTSTANPGHVGLVIGGGRMIAAPHSGTVVQIQPYQRSTLLGFTRPAASR